MRRPIAARTLAPTGFFATSIRFLLANSLLLIGGSIAGMIWANAAHASYEPLARSMQFFVNEVAMCFFFAIAAKEIWEAFLPGGALSSPKKAATPLLATLGGVVAPAALYLAGTVHFDAPDLARGWAIPCATDIAFSYLVARIVFGAGHPAIPFLLLLAIADDAVGLAILALFYPTGALDLSIFFACVGGAVVLNRVVLRRLGVKNFWAYLLFAGPLSWYGFYAGGIHPALALVPIIPTLPHEPTDAGLFAEEDLPRPLRRHDALNELEHFFKVPVEVVLLLFGFVNAGVVVGNVGLASGLVGASLLVGKPVGIVLATLLAVRVFRLEMPRGMNLRDVVVVGFMAGIGFTVAIFVATVAFPPGPVLDAAKMGALFSFGASILSFAVANLLGVTKRASA